MSLAKLTSDDCRALADEAEALAKQVSLNPAREGLLEEARSWRERAERIDRGCDDPPPGRLV